MAGNDGMDEVLTALGCGRRVVPIFALVVVANVAPINMIASTFLSAPMPFRCLPLDADAYYSRLVYFITESNSLENNSISIPATAQTHWYDSKCLELNGPKENIKLDMFNSSSPPVVIHLDPYRHATGLPSCPMIEYDRSMFTSTIISEFDLVCERSHMRPLFQMMITTGALLGCSVVGQLGYSLGRKRTVQMGALLGLPACVGIAFVPWYSMVLLLRIMIGIAGRMLVIGSTSLVMETIPPRYRTIVGMFMGIPYSISMTLFSVAAYFVREWRYLQLIIMLPYFLAVPLSFTLDESPRWLVQKGRGQEAVEVIMRSSEQNHSPIPVRLLPILENLKYETGSSEKRKSEGGVALCERFQGALQGVGQYWHSRAMVIIIVVPCVFWFLISFSYSGIILNINNFTSTNPFVFLGTMGIMEVVSLLLATPVTHKLGRRPSIGVGAIISGTLLALEPFVTTELMLVRWIVIACAYFLIGGVWQIAFTYTPELYPTDLRTQGLSLSYWMATVGVLVTPLVTDFLVQVVSWAPSVLFGISAILISFFMPLLPETNNRPLPENIQDVENRHKNKSGKNLTEKSTTPSSVV